MKNSIKKIVAMLMISGILLTPCLGSELYDSGLSGISSSTTSVKPTNTEFENFDQKSNQLFNILSTVVKAMNEMSMGVVRNIL